MATDNHQREGVSSNTYAGKMFEEKVFKFLEKKGFDLQYQKQIKIGINVKKKHAFDLGNEKIIVECKSNTWTETGNVPSAKIKGWIEAMFYFYLAPEEYKKLFFVEMSFDQKRCKTLLEYFIEHYYHLIPRDIVLVDFYTENDNIDFYVYDETAKIHVRNGEYDIKNVLEKRTINEFF